MKGAFSVGGFPVRVLVGGKNKSGSTAGTPSNIRGALVSALVSLMLPGASQICDGRRAEGILFMVGVAMWYVLFMPVGWIVHVWNVVDSFSHRAVSR